MSDDLIMCAICGESFNTISWKHLRHHNMTLSEYKTQFPNHPIKSLSAIQRKKEASQRTNALRVGIPRDESVKQKIKQTKQNNPKSPWNKGRSLTDDEKKHLSKTRKQLYASGQLVHWNLDKHHSANTKQKISQTAKSQNRTYSQTSLEKRTNTLDTKKQQGWVHNSTLNKGQPSNLSDIGRQKIQETSKRTNSHSRQLRYKKLSEHLLQYNIEIESTDGYNFVLKCSVCNNTFTRTSSVLVPYRYQLYEGEYCPICYPPQYGYYSDMLFEQRPELKEQLGILYIATVTDNETFIKIGITNRTAHQRLLSEPYCFSILYEIPMSLYDAYQLEQRLLTTLADYKYVPIIGFGGKTECLIPESLPLIEQLLKDINAVY